MARRALTWSAAAVVLSAPQAVAAEVDPLDLARRIARLGPRAAGSPAKEEAVLVLRSAMESAGLEQIRLLPIGDQPQLRLLEGVLPGESGLEVLVTAHLDTVESSPGAADDAAGCAVAIAAAAHLAEIPRRHGLRIVLFDGEESGLLGSRAWVGSLDATRKKQVLAAINVDLIGWRSDLRGVVLPLLTAQGDWRRGAPGWLVAAALEAGRSVGEPMSVASTTVSVVGQVLVRSLELVRASDAEALLAGGLPAITVTDAGLFRSDPGNHQPGDTGERLSASALDVWVDRLGATVLRLDGLSGRPRDDDQYLAVLGRVWSRRDLYWLGLAVWVVLVFQGLPGAWLGARAAQRRRGGRLYLPGFAARVVFLGCVLMLPVFTSVLLVPAAVATLLPARLRLTQRWKLGIASAPLLVTLVGLLWLTSRGEVEAIAIGLPAALLLATGFASLVWMIVTEQDMRLQIARASSPRRATADSHSSREL